MPGASDLERMQGAFISNEEVKKSSISSKPKTTLISTIISKTLFSRIRKKKSLRNLRTQGKETKIKYRPNCSTHCNSA